MDQLLFRQIHLDFHTSEALGRVGDRFDPERFADTLKNAHVNSVTLFARCHHGMMYYDSRRNPERIHPGLVNKNLLRDQIEACHKAGIRTPIYTTVQWDYYTAREHREWLCMDEKGQTFGEEGPQLPTEAGFYARLCINTLYRQFLKDHVEELLESFSPVDGLFLDIVVPVPCMCPACQEKMRRQGYHPLSLEDRKKFAQESIDVWQQEMTDFIKRREPEASVFYNRGHVGTPHRVSGDSYTHFELESLPSGIWGYLHFPSAVRYARTLGKEYLAHTGKFHTMWGDFHSYKNRAALEFECFHMLAMGSKCLIGDQLNPDGELTEAVYDLVGEVYGQVEQKEAWCGNISPAVEIGVLTPEEFSGADGACIPQALQGAVRMLQESAFQFDVVDSYSDYGKYKLLILPDEIPVEGRLAERLTEYINSGGKIICTCKSGLLADESGFALDIGVRKLEEQPRDVYGHEVVNVIKDRGDYCQYILTGEEIGRDLPKTYHVMYIRGLNVAAEEGAQVLADAYSSAFDRDFRHFCSHRQSPCSGEKAQPAVIRKGNTVYFSHPIFTQYYYNGPLWCKKMLQDAVGLLLEERLAEHDGPSSLILTVNDQRGQNRRVVHLLHYIPERRCRTIDIIEDVIPLFHVKCRIKAEKQVQGVLCQPQGEELGFEQAGGTVLFEVPEINGHQIVEIRYAD